MSTKQSTVVHLILCLTVPESQKSIMLWCKYTAKLSNSPLPQHPCTIIQKSSAQVTRSGWTSRLLPGAAGRRRRRRKEEKWNEWTKGMMEGRSAAEWCVSSYVGACRPLHLLWTLTVDGEWYACGVGVGSLGSWRWSCVPPVSQTSWEEVGPVQNSSALFQYPFPPCTWRPPRPHVHPAHACVSEKSAPTHSPPPPSFCPPAKSH